MSKENGIVDFEADFLPYFRDHYPQFKAPPEGPFSDEVLEGYFDYAVNFILTNNPNHRPRICWKRRLILYCYLVLHQGQLWIRGMGVVGITTNASQGSISQGIQPLQTNINNQWLGQTQWGQMFLNALRLYTGFQYVPGQRPNWK